MLNETERLQTPYDWLVRPTCRDQVRPQLGLQAWLRCRQCRMPAVCPGPQPSLVQPLLLSPRTLLSPAHPRPLLHPLHPQFKAYITSIVNRRNSITSVLYKDDPAIFS